jgi:hypothetical protein
MNVLISYANERYAKSQDILLKSSIEYGKVDKVINYNPEYIKSKSFYIKNKYILDKTRGAGCWCWKFFIILETLNTLEEGDCVLYLDAGIEVLDNINPLIKIAQESSNNGPMLFRLPGGHKNKTWTKRDCFILTYCDSEKYWNGDLVNGAISLWVKNEKNINFLKEWLRYARDPRIITDDTLMCGKPNLLEFKDHRHDQSILSLMAIKYNLEVWRSPCQWGNEDKDKFTNSEYGQLINHHRGDFSQLKNKY